MTKRGGMHVPIEAAMSRSIQALEQIFEDCAIVIVVAPFGAEPGRRANYIGNGKREDIFSLLKEVVARWEGTYQSGPKMPQ